jgi:hypothetical protein
MGLPDGLDTEVIIGYLMVFILSVIVLVYLGYDISWFIASSKKKKKGNKDAKEGKVSKVVGDGNEDEKEGVEKAAVKKRGKVEAS